MLILKLLFCLHTPLCSLSDSGCFGKVYEESHRALQGWLGSAEPDGLHPERGALACSALLKYIFPKLSTSHKAPNWLELVVCSILLSTKPENHRGRDHRAVCLMLFWLWWEFSTWEATCYIQFLHSVGLLIWYALPSVHTGTRVSSGFPMGEAQTGSMYCAEQDHVSKNTPVLCSPLSPSVQMLWVEQLHRLVVEPVL